MSAYRDELIQVAAVALAMIQLEDMGTTQLGALGRISMEKTMLDVEMERNHQEAKWGTRTAQNTTREHWYTILGEEFGEVGRAILEGK